MPGMRLTPNVLIKCNGADLPQTDMDNLIDLRVERSIGMASRCNLRIRYKLDGWSMTIGQSLEVSFTDENKSTAKVFKGEIVALGAEFDFDGYELTITAYDKSHRLSLVTRTKTYLKQSYPDVIRQIAGQYGLTTSLDSPGLGSTVHDYLVQASTDHAFLTQICLRTGCEWYVDETEKLYVRPRGTTDGVTLKLGETLEKLKVRFSGAEHASKVKVMGWDAAKKVAIVAEDSGALSAAGGAPIFQASGALDGAFASAPLQTSTLPVLTQAEAATVAKGLGTRLATSKMVLKGQNTLTPGLKVGTMVTIEGAGPKLNGKYYVTAVEHVYGSNGADTRFTAGGLEPSSLVDLLGSADHGVAPWSQLGVVVGIVTNNDQTVGNDKPGPGRVKVKFPTLSDSLESAPARLVCAEAGNGKGTYYIPEINDEVLVAFEHGDPRRPYILGAMWNEKDMPPNVTDIVKNGKVMARHTRSRLGHTMTFNDGEADDKKNLTILLADGKTTLVLGHDKIDIIANDGKPITISNGKASITLTDAGEINIKGKKIFLNADNITIDADQKVAVVGGEISNSAMQKMKLASDGPVDVKSSAILSLKGSMVKIN